MGSHLQPVGGAWQREYSEQKLQEFLERCRIVRMQEFCSILNEATLRRDLLASSKLEALSLSLQYLYCSRPRIL